MIKVVGAGAEVLKKHAGFIVNIEHATSTDYLDLIRVIQETEKNKFKIDIETEGKILGEENQKEDRWEIQDWASYWHIRIMRKLNLDSNKAIVYAKLTAGVFHQSKTSMTILPLFIF
ncbi:SpoVR family protein [Gottfriedia acidiceleris]|uniref:SpoVR family protein n=1 Tax=Gottfriedia acidiceleris TaxID=371036 RepID=UPI00101C5229|nr:SpoVR family protein [Gottfriedia acidiceleris]